MLVHCDGRRKADQAMLDEFAQLVDAAGAINLGLVRTTKEPPDPKYFIGTGKVEEIASQIKELAIELVVFNHSLSPAQERNLERAFACRVVDRTGLILDLFAQRARSFAGKLQVELAQLEHLSTRLVRGWTHLERQKGGIGLRGPGETQLETDRRLLGKRIAHLNERLNLVSAQRARGRKARKKAQVPVISLVGYTNAGKSTLFNRLTQAGVFAENQLFATLDPTIRRLNLPLGNEAVLVDTVGFISHLPHELISAFHSTLEETCEADLLLHVIDAADPQSDRCREEVNRVLQEIGAHEVPQIEVWNKTDLLEEGYFPVPGDSSGGDGQAWVSAVTGQGVDSLLEKVARFVGRGRVRQEVQLDLNQGDLRAALYRLGGVIEETSSAEGWRILLDIAPEELNGLKKRFAVG